MNGVENNYTLRNSHVEGGNRLNNSHNEVNHMMGSPGMRQFAPKSPYGVNFDNVNLIKKNEQRQYREDLDYLISLRRRLGDEEFDRLYGTDLLRRVQRMDDKYVYNRYENKNFMKNLMKQHENEAMNHKDKEREQKIHELENDKKFLDSIEYQKYLENQKKLEQKMKLKNEHLNDLENYYKRKNEEEVKKYEEGLMSKKLLDEQDKKFYEREIQYKNKLNNLNNKIYDKAINYSGYLQNNSNSSPRINEPFYVKNDFEFNKKLAEIKAMEKENNRKDSTAVNERLKAMEMYKEYENKIKMEKLDHQKNYRDYLDHQKILKNYEKSQKDNVDSDQLLMPGYHYPNRPIPIAKKAVDGVTWVKHNHLETLQNGYKNYYLGDSRLRHNPIVQPLDDIDYNKYVNKQRQFYSNSLNTSLSNVNLAQDSKTLAKAGNQLFN